MEQESIALGEVTNYLRLLGNGLNDFKVGLDGPLPRVPQNSFYQVKIICPYLDSMRVRRTPLEVASIFFGVCPDDKVDLTIEFYGLQGHVKGSLARYNPRQPNKRKMGDVNYQIVGKTEGEVLVISHGAYAPKQLVRGVNHTVRILQRFFQMYEVPEADEMWAERREYAISLRKLQQAIGDPSEWFWLGDADFVRRRLLLERVRKA